MMSFFNTTGGWSVGSGSLSYGSVGGVTGAYMWQMARDAEDLTPQEYGEKYGTTYMNEGYWKSDATTTSSGSLSNGDFTVHGIRDVWIDNWVEQQSQNGPWLGEQSPNSAYTIRGNDVGVGNLFFEYLTGTGPEYSMFTDGHPMVNALKDSYIVSLAKIKFTLGGSNPLIQWDAPFGLVGAGLSNSLTEQFVGGARVSIIPTAAGMLFMVDNTTGRYSFHGHSQPDIPRNPSMLTPEGNIYQRFIWLQK